MDTRFDEREALERLLGDEELLLDLVNSFIQTAPGLMERIQLAIADQESANVDINAHTLKSLVGSLGAPVAFEMLYSLERMGKEKNLAYAGETFQSLIVEMDALTKELLNYQQVHRPAA